MLFTKFQDLTFKVGAKNLNSVQVDGAATVQGQNIATEKLSVNLNGAVRYYDGFTNDARLVLDTLGEAPKNLLSEEGRVMVLRKGSRQNHVVKIVEPG